MQNDIPLTEQVRQALDTWTEIHEHAEAAAAARDDLKRLVGSNDAERKERKERKADTPPDVYAENVLELAQAEVNYKAATAAEERAEKALNVLREMLNYEAAALQREAIERKDDTARIYRDVAMLNSATADTNLQAAQMAETTAQRYVMLANKPALVDTRSRYTTKPAAAVLDDDDEASKPF